MNRIVIKLNRTVIFTIICLTLILSAAGCFDRSIGNSSINEAKSEYANSEAKTKSENTEKQDGAAAESATKNNAEQKQSDASTTMDNIIIDEAKIDNASSIYIGMSLEQLFKFVVERRFTVSIDNQYASYDSRGLGFHKPSGTYFLEFSPFHISFDNDLNVTTVQVFLTEENADLIKTDYIKKDMTVKEVKEHFGEPYENSVQDDGAIYLYKIGGQYLEMFFNLTDYENEDMAKLHMFTLNKNAEDCFLNN